MSEVWVSDANGNRCSSIYFGSVEKAQASLDSLEKCEDCVNCSYCSGCWFFDNTDDAMADMKRLAQPVEQQ